MGPGIEPINLILRQGEQLCTRRFEPRLFVNLRLGRKEDSATSEPSPGALGSREAAVALEVAIREAGSLQQLPASSVMVTPDTPASRIDLATLDRKQIGKPMTGNRHDGFEEAEAGNQLPVSLVRYSYRKRGTYR